MNVVIQGCTCTSCQELLAKNNGAGESLLVLPSTIFDSASLAQSSHGYSKSTASQAGTKSFAHLFCYEPKTQKAKGILNLQNIFYHSASAYDKYWKYLPAVVLSDKDKIKEAAEALHSNKVFATSLGNRNVILRPCPKTPRHGFVDSKSYNLSNISVDDFEKIIHETFDKMREVDPESELVIQPFMKANYSAIWVPGQLTLARGHDGATSGKDCYTFNLPYQESYKKHWQTYGVSEENGEVPYIEVVYDATSEETRRPWAVQFRSGPKLDTNGSPDFVPKEMTVETVVPAEGDLLEWEHKMKKLAGKKGLVISHYKGSLSSHYAAHAILNKIPIVTSFDPKVGDKLQKHTHSVEKLDLERLRYGVYAGLTHAIPNNAIREACGLAIWGTHCSSEWVLTNRMFELGVCAGLLLRFAASASIGEWRHSGKAGAAVANLDRNSIYMKVVSDYFKNRYMIPQSLDSFAYEEWGRAFGGKNWANCTAMTIDLDTMLMNCISGTVPIDPAKISVLCHRIVNVCHNNGKMLTKFLSNEGFEAAAKGYVSFIARYAIMWMVLKYDHASKEAEFLYKGAVNSKDIKGLLKKLECKTMTYWNDGDWKDLGALGKIERVTAVFKKLDILGSEMELLHIQYKVDSGAEVPKNIYEKNSATSFQTVNVPVPKGGSLGCVSTNSFTGGSEYNKMGTKFNGAIFQMFANQDIGPVAYLDPLDGKVVPLFICETKQLHVQKT